MGEILLVGTVYVLLAHLFVWTADVPALMPAWMAAPERAVGAGFLAGALVQLAMVTAIALISGTMRSALRGSFKPGNAAAWAVALIAVAIHAATVTFFFIEDPALIAEPSWRNLFLSALPAIDGWTQEVMFRGYVIYRLARSGAPAGVQIMASAILFSAIHFGYAGADIWSIFWPMFGTAVLGGFLAWSVRLGNGALLPAVVAHMLLIVIVQPWLALA